MSDEYEFLKKSGSENEIPSIETGSFDNEFRKTMPERKQTATMLSLNGEMTEHYMMANPMNIRSTVAVQLANASILEVTKERDPMQRTSLISRTRSLQKEDRVIDSDIPSFEYDEQDLNEILDDSRAVIAQRKHRGSYLNLTRNKGLGASRTQAVI